MSALEGIQTGGSTTGTQKDNLMDRLPRTGRGGVGDFFFFRQVFYSRPSVPFPVRGSPQQPCFDGDVVWLCLLAHGVRDSFLRLLYS